MKKNITINLCGRLFQIDEDAYELLQNYIESLHASFGRQEGGEEIADDIEERIAELFEELKANGTEAITIDHVKDIISRIGEPEQLTGEEEGSERTDENSGKHSTAQDILNNVRARTAGKRLYRNPNDKMLAGVLSGFAAYTGTDATWWRIGYVLLLLGSNLFLGPLFRLLHLGGFFFSINMTLVLLYIILAFAMPEAKKPQQMLEMEGKDVTPQSLADVVVEDKQPVQQHRGCLGSSFSVILSIIAGIFVGFAAIFGLILLVCLLLIIVSIIIVFTVPSAIHIPLPFDINYLNLAEMYTSHPWVVAVFIIGLLLTLFIPLYAIGHMLLSKSGKIQPMGVGQRILWIVLWLAALFSMIPSLIWVHEQASEREMAHYRKTHTYQGVVMSSQDKDFLRQGDWKLIKAENCAHLTYSGEHWSGDPNARYLDAWNGDCEEVYQVEHTGQVEPGIYRLDCLARAEGPGTYIYAQADKLTMFKQIPAYGNSGGEFVEQVREKMADIQIKDSVRKKLVSTTTFEIMGMKFHINDYEENNSKSMSDYFGEGKGWSLVSIDSIVVYNGSITYGVSTDAAFTGQPCHAQWFSASDFKVTRIGDLP
ncbi:MAG: PspC domain-containing protein [Prevotella sp.]|nr:PspC domain-containing protein [Prevotella sp.]